MAKMKSRERKGTTSAHNSTTRRERVARGSVLPPAPGGVQDAWEGRSRASTRTSERFKWRPNRAIASQSCARRNMVYFTDSCIREICVRRARSCVGCKRWLPGEALEPHSRCVSCRPTMCSAEDRCSQCSHLSLLQFQAYVKDAEKRSAKEKKRAKSSGGSSEKCSRRQEPASEAPWASKFVAVEVDLAAMKASIGQLLVVLLPPASGSAFSVFADGGASVRSAPRLVPGVAGPRSSPGSGPSVVAAGSSGASLSVSPLPGLAPGVSGGQAPSVPSLTPELAVRGSGSGREGVQSSAVSGSSLDFSGFRGVSFSVALLPTVTPAVLSRPVAAGADPGGAVVSQAADTGWSLFSEEVDEVFDDVPTGEAGSPDEEGGSSFCELITSVRESLGLPMPSSLASTLQTRVEHTSGTSRPGPTPLVLPRSPLALEFRREQLDCSLGISNPASARFTLPRRQAVVRNLPNTYGDWERRQLMSSPIGPHLFDGQTLATVEQRELESLQRSLVSQIARGLASSAQGVRAKASGAVGSRRLVPAALPLVLPPPALKVSGFFRSRGIFRGRSRGCWGSR
ncbi:hypothetical protein E2C01_043806 [Portunus trituberculatus]|uniref:Uncharacterized protein n=1 Tax=Portunus trituberculatus TaxID=210409 RepID=A0A5B7FYP5_PORTR|nr:hypothetical protein [Portunus trituberculatus]